MAVTISLDGRQSLAPEAQCLARLRARLHLHLQACSLQGRYLHLASQRCCREVQQQVVYQVVIIADEGVVFLLLNEYLNIAVDTFVLSCISLAGHVDDHAFSHAGRNLYLYDFFSLLNTRAATMLTLVLDDGTLAAAGRTDALCLHHAEDALCGMGDDARTVTRRTLVAGAASLSTRSVTV